MILSVSRAEGRTRLSVTTTNDVTVWYTLLYTNLTGLGAPLDLWPHGANPAAGTGAPVVLEDATAEADRVYAVRAAR